MSQPSSSPKSPSSPSPSSVKQPYKPRIQTPSQIYGGSRTFLANVIVKSIIGDALHPDAWTPLNGHVSELVAKNKFDEVRRAVYAAREKLTVIRVMVEANDYPDVVYASGSGIPPGWHEFNLLTWERLEKIEANFDRELARENASASKIADFKKRWSAIQEAWDQSNLKPYTTNK